MKILSFIFTLAISSTCMGQKNEYLVKVNGDTIWGSIQLKSNIFKVTGKDTEELISAGEVNKIKSKKYKGNTVVQCRLELYSDDYYALEFSYVKLIHADTVMILNKIYSTPKIDLYFGTDEIKTPFYFYKTPSDPFPVQLVVRYHLDGGLNNYYSNRGRYAGDKSKVLILEDKGFVNQLRFIMDDCKDIPESTWELLAYRDYSLKQLLKK
ncbi:MAG: hypothetical protein ABI685_15140, partial [Ferruginibacter sp.]